MDWTLEVVVLPVSDIDRAVAFYRDQVGFELDHDTRTEHMHVVQLTPRGSGCSIVIGDLPSQNEMAPGSLKGLQLVVSNLPKARAELVERGVDVTEIQIAGPGGFRPANDGEDLDNVGFVFFADPDGNSWAVQQISSRP